MLVKEHLHYFFREMATFGGFFFFASIIFFVGVIGEWILFNQLILGFVLVYGISIILKHFYFKTRPKKQRFTNWFEKLEASAFPSTHAMSSVFLALIFMDFFAKLLLDIVLLAAVALISYSRIYLEKHDYVDVTVGLVVGVVSFALTKLIL